MANTPMVKNGPTTLCTFIERLAHIEKPFAPSTGINTIRPNNMLRPVIARTTNEIAVYQCMHLSQNCHLGTVSPDFSDSNLILPRIRKNATIPIIEQQIGHAQSDVAKVGGGEDIHSGGYALNADNYANPLPHVLMLTAIVVGVSTLGVALAVVQKVHGEYGTIEEDEILAQIRSGRG